MRPRSAIAAAICSAALFAGDAAAAEGIEFDVSAFEKKPFEWSGYLELRPERQRLDRGSALYGLQFPNDIRDHLSRTAAGAEISGVYRQGDVRFNFTAHASHLDDARGSSRDARFYEAYGAWQAAPGVAVEAGKRTLRWGKAYAWSPVAFFERSKDPTDPEVSREGFTLATASVVRSFSGPLTTLSFTPVVLPTGRGLNEGYGPGEHWNAGGRLYALVADTDIDVVYAARGSRAPRAGVDFSRNLGTHLEIHGEWAREAHSHAAYVLGLRYLSEAQTTFIAEYFHNGAGHTRDEARRFFALAHAAAADPALRPIAAQAASAGFVGPNPMREYVYLRMSQPEPFGILYLTPALTTIVNATDRSYTVIPELLYTRVTNLEMRLRLQVNRGARLTDFGEKAVDSRVELRLRYFF